MDFGGNGSEILTAIMSTRVKVRQRQTRILECHWLRHWDKSIVDSAICTGNAGTTRCSN